ncbi:MAG: hypothetical protein KIT58_09090 [Planctomycetota bacterium]|nr:hypothetical protein [Planctomycetota bacterium]
MDQTLRTLGRAASATGDREAVLRHALARVRAGALVALTRVDARKQDEEARAKERWPRLYVGSEPEGGDLTPHARRPRRGARAARVAWSEGHLVAQGGLRLWVFPCLRAPGRGRARAGDVWVDAYVDPREREVGLA